ncbi:MAG TPA: FAD-binding oxidoreductase [Candidatus Paceibacterota bacterium]|nr:FAD-binding oxidoreductase [Candidatus Paceibacterota bacterium]
MDELKRVLSTTLEGEVTDAQDERTKYSRDTSLFTRMPELVVYPKDANDVSTLVREIAAAKQRGEDVSVTARSAGTDMSGGPLTRSVVAVFTKYLNKVHEVGEGYAVVEPGAYYRDFERKTLAKGYILPSYPASRSICALGGIINNDSGGERTLEYGKTRKYVEELDVVLADGSHATLKALTPAELERKKELTTFEGEIYRKMDALLRANTSTISKAAPKVSKNSAGYALWDIVDTKTGLFNLAKLITGAQGTLALTTKAKLSLVKPQPYRSMLVVMLSDFKDLPEIVRIVLRSNPESFESYDDHTFKLAIRFLPQMLSQMGLLRAVRLGLAFIPELFMVLRGGVPKLVLMAEFSEDSHEEAVRRATEAKAALAKFTLPAKVLRDEAASEKYWVVRRESFALLRKNLSGYYASPFIDDFVVPPESYPEFLPKLYALLDEYKLIDTIAGHIGNGNFHIIPLMDLHDPKTKDVILELSRRVYDLVIEYGGTTTGEHNDGIIRTPFLPQLFGNEVMHLFEETKRIFDPLGIFNPGKKVGGTFADIERDLLTQS